MKTREIPNRTLVKQAKREWINRMLKLYPNFKHKLWGRSNNYRINHPQPAIK